MHQKNIIKWPKQREKDNKNTGMCCHFLPHSLLLLTIKNIKKK